MTIIKEILKWKPKVKILMDKTKENQILQEISYNLELEIFKLYKKLFSSFMSSRIDTSIFLEKPTNEEKTNWSRRICLNESGFSVQRSRYYQKSDYINTFGELFEMFEYFKEWLPYIENKKKKKLVKRFFKKFKEIKDLEYKLLQKLKKEIEVVLPNKDDEDRTKNNQENYLFLLYINATIFFPKQEKGEWNDYEIRLSHSPPVENYLFIEKSYPNMIKLSKDYKRLMLRMIKQRQKVLDYLKTEFSSELILMSLDK